MEDEHEISRCTGTGWTRGVMMDRVGKRNHDGQGGQEGSRWTGWIGGGHDGQNGQEGSRWTGWTGGITMNWVDRRKRDGQEEDGKKDKRHQVGLGGEERSGWTIGVTLDRRTK